MEDILLPFKSNGFSLLELLFALALLSFGLTALLQTHHIAAGSLKSTQERYHALLLAQEWMDAALVSEKKNNQTDKVYRSNVLYAISRKVVQSANDCVKIIIDVQWRTFHLSIDSCYPDF
ncbi:MAG: hypothetical protein OMM_07484 [Candidatus Magnetoglobus multicellularis str. Araruama]|uniref:Prepilin-type N-terminal cleavage/methylation domain-containing protein n=1 Tax=Candidatus Magnetoglobus multicellularis str. Araruama TaxID=890399 RepID=A0A1V1PCG5_9BACT|nr:MAG: hypothetical protein OMM_07484 [Candidatus Magnetoglobus multicellularis str. Araruama]